MHTVKVGHQRWAAIAIAGLCAIVLCVFMRNWGYDDPYITFRYSQNLVNGNGFVYNVGDLTLSTTAPLYALILALFRVFNLSLPVVGIVIGSLALALSGLALWELGQLWKTPVVGWAGLVILPFFPILAMTVGSESPLTVALGLWGIVAYVARRYTWSAVLLALAILCRADSGLILPVLAVHYLFSHSFNGADRGQREPFPWRGVVVGAVILSAWFGFAWLYFGSPLPVTLAAKRAQGLMTISQSYWQGIGLLVDQYWALLRYRLPMSLFLVGLVWLARRRTWLLLMAWGGLHLLAYVLLGVTRYYWYYAQLVPSIVVAVGLGIDAVTTVSARWIRRRGAEILAVVLIMSIAGVQFGTVHRIGSKPDPRLPIFRQVGEWLNLNTPVDASIGTLEVGVIGFYAERAMIDFAGLLQPDVAAVFGPSTTYEDSAQWAIDHYRPDYLVFTGDSLSQTRESASVAEACTQFHTIERDDYPVPLLILRCQW